LVHNCVPRELIGFSQTFYRRVLVEIESAMHFERESNREQAKKVCEKALEIDSGAIGRKGKCLSHFTPPTPWAGIKLAAGRTALQIDAPGSPYAQSTHAALDQLANQAY
jgi:hypothetical protein